MEKDGKTWVVYQLSQLGEALAEKGELQSKVEKHSQGKEVFIPYSKVEFQGKLTKISVIEGYFFIESGLEDDIYFKIGNKPYVEVLLHTSSNKGVALQTIPDKDVQKLKDNLQELISSDLELGMAVTVTSGVYKGIKGEIVGFSSDRENAFVYIELRTLKAIRAIPTFVLEIQEEDQDV